MATAYKYKQRDSSGGDDWYINYNITPDLDQNVVAGETIRVEGELYDSLDPTTSIEIRLGDPLKDYTSVGYTDVYIAKGKRKRFVLSFELPDMTGKFTAGERGQSFAIHFYTNTNKPAHITRYYPATTQKLKVLRYRLNPQILALDVARCDVNGKPDDQGEYVRCRKFKVSINPGYDHSGFVIDMKSVLAPDFSGNSVLDTWSIPESAFSEEGYSDPESYSGRLFGTWRMETTKEYVASIAINDGAERVIRHSEKIPRAFARLHLSGAPQGGVAVGMFSSVDPNNPDAPPKFEVAETHKSIFYGGIEAVNNFASGEMETYGHWIDGKPIYRYIWTGSVTGTGAKTLATLNLSIDTLISLSGSIYRETDKRYNGLAFAGSDSANNNSVYLVQSTVDSLEIRYGCNSGFTGSKSIVVIFDYTKA